LFFLGVLGGRRISDDLGLTIGPIKGPVTRSMLRCDGRPWSRRGRKSMENDEKEMECSGIWRNR